MATNYIFILLIPSSHITFGLVSRFTEQIPEKSQLSTLQMAGMDIKAIIQSPSWRSNYSIPST